jgi:hypothetical protein
LRTPSKKFLQEAASPIEALYLGAERYGTLEWCADVGGQERWHGLVVVALTQFEQLIALEVWAGGSDGRTVVRALVAHISVTDQSADEELGPASLPGRMLSALDVAVDRAHPGLRHIGDWC